MSGDVNGDARGEVAARVAEFVALRRSLGYRSPTQERTLRSFARYLDTAGHQGPIPLELSLDSATSTASTDPYNPARRLSVVRGFLRQLAGADGATEVPLPGLLGSNGHRKPPHIYSDEEIGDLLDAAAGLVPVDGLRPHCYATLFALITCTGLRISEALALTCDDVDLAGGVLTVRAGKRGRTRLVALHPSALSPLGRYAAEREQRYGQPDGGQTFFRTDRSDRVSYGAADHAFSVLRKQLGWTAVGRTRTPRIHDLRHTMVVRRIQTWHAHNVNVDAKIAVLATHMGHVEVRNLYWYFSVVPELMNIISTRFEAFADPGSGVS